MSRSTGRRWPVIGLAATVIALLAPGIAHAEAPSNDDFDHATAITAVPFTVTEDTVEATRVDDDPPACGLFSRNTVWFDYTAPQDAIVSVTLQSNEFSPNFTAYTGARGQLTPVPGSCTRFTNVPHGFHVTAGTTYHFMVMAEFGFGHSFTMNLENVPPSPNDDFAAAVPVTAVPSQFSVDLSRAGAEPNEPSPSCGADTTQSVWFVYRPQVTQFVSAAEQFSFESPSTITTYRGTALANLSEVDCARGSAAVFHALAGETYYLRVANVPDSATTFDLFFGVAPPITPSVFWNPNPGNVFNDVFFQVFPGDQLGRFLVSGQLSFGDGATVPITDAFPEFQHRYARDGTYQLVVTGSTSDGRTGTGTATLTVETHDVTITDLAVPARARAGQTKPISVTIANTRLDQTVQVELFKVSGDSLIHIGTLTQFVPARADRTVLFPFAYTFGTADADAGSVSFKALATLLSSADDDHPIDNEKVATTTVR
jgi:hypothetical protein